MSFSAFSLGWQDVATAMRSGEKRPKLARSAKRHAGPRRIPQETVRAIRADVEAKLLTRVAIARKYDVSENFVYQVTQGGMRSDEQEKLR